MDKRIEAPFELTRLSFVNYICCRKARKKLEEIALANSVASLRMQLRNKLQEESICCICFIDNNDVTLFPCYHTCCGTCYDKLTQYKNNCPLCRRDVNFSLSLRSMGIIWLLIFYYCLEKYTKLLIENEAEPSVRSRLLSGLRPVEHFRINNIDISWFNNDILQRFSWSSVRLW
jgi:hypothetical protein